MSHDELAVAVAENHDQVTNGNHYGKHVNPSPDIGYGQSRWMVRLGIKQVMLPISHGLIMQNGLLFIQGVNSPLILRIMHQYFFERLGMDET